MKTPKYEAIKQDLLAEIKAKKFFPGDKFYSESEIKEKFDVSSITAVKALNELTAAGYIYRIQGKGSFVSKSKIQKLVKFTDIELNRFEDANVQIFSATKESSSGILKKLGLPEDGYYYRFIRVRSYDEEPFILHYSYINPQVLNEPLGPLEDYRSIYDRVHKDYGVDLFSMRSVQTDQIIFPPNKEVRDYLLLNSNEPAIVQEKYTYLPDGSIAEYNKSYKHWRYYKIKIETDSE
jgi:DNA-binding GntR family transcriptional regulator